jgi:23S rRNA (guanosine2251-2'-O)-methyltransferase
MKQEKPAPFFQSFECQNSSCQLRFSGDLSISRVDICPGCGGKMIRSGFPYTNFQRPAVGNLTPGFSLQLILDNLRSAQNVGSIFRTANGAGIKHIHCCGITPTPEHTGVRKASLGAEISTPWSYHPNTLKLVKDIKTSGSNLVSLESTRDSSSFFEMEMDFQSHTEIVLTVGNEISGIDPEVLAISDLVIHIPMTGIKTSLNVAVATGIVLYWMIGQLNRAK